MSDAEMNAIVRQKETVVVPSPSSSMVDAACRLSLVRGSANRVKVTEGICVDLDHFGGEIRFVMLA